MIISASELKTLIDTELPEKRLAWKMSAIETNIRAYTNNNFQNRGIRVKAYATNNLLKCIGSVEGFEVGDTVMITDSAYQNGKLCVIQDIIGTDFKIDSALYREHVLVTKVEYPDDVVEGAISILEWKLKNEAAAMGDKTAMKIQSETISRHSVSYAQDSTETDIDPDFGVPKKLVAFLEAYMKARW